jgi:hypothetical protein
MEDTELAWAAGFFDGEGCITVFKSTLYGPKLNVSIGQVVKAPLQVLHDMFGGTLYWKEAYGSHKSGIWMLEWRDGKSESFLKSILPYLVVKRSQAELALEFISLRGTRGVKPALQVVERREQIRVEMRDLKKVV